MTMSGMSPTVLVAGAIFWFSVLAGSGTWFTLNDKSERHHIVIPCRRVAVGLVGLPLESHPGVVARTAIFLLLCSYHPRYPHHILHRNSQHIYSSYRYATIASIRCTSVLKLLIFTCWLLLASMANGSVSTHSPAGTSAESDVYARMLNTVGSWITGR